MVAAVFVAPYLLDATTRFVRAAAALPDVELAVVTCDPADRMPAELRSSLAGHWRIDDPLDAGQIAAAVQGLGAQLGPAQALLAVLEQLQVPLAQVREHLGIGGIDVATAHNFRDKAQMKSVLRAAGVPCARHRLADSAAAAAGFAAEVGFPLVVKPPAGAGAKSTFRLDDTDDLRVWLAAAPPAPDRLALLEEFLTGEEGSYDSVMTGGQVVWDSVSGYRRRCARSGCAPGSPTWSGSGARTAPSPSPRSRCGRRAARSPRCSATRTTSTCTAPGRS